MFPFLSNISCTLGMYKIKLFQLLLVILWTSCTTQIVGTIPFDTDVKMQIDGLFGEEEWSKAKLVRITPNNSLYLIQNQKYLFLGVRNNEKVGRYLDLYLENDSIGAINLHASMQLGERQLTEDWNDTIPKWNWGNNREWTANMVGFLDDNEHHSFLESVRPYQGFEFQISKKKIRSKKVRIRLEIKDFVGQADEIIYPIESHRKIANDWLFLELK